MFQEKHSNGSSAALSLSQASQGKNHFHTVFQVKPSHNLLHKPKDGHLFLIHHTTEASTMLSNSYQEYDTEILSDSRYKDFCWNFPNNRYSTPCSDYTFTINLYFMHFRTDKSIEKPFLCGNDRASSFVKFAFARSSLLPVLLAYRYNPLAERNELNHA